MNEDEPNPLLFTYENTPSGGKPMIPLRLTCTHEVVVGASIAPSLPTTVISPLWAQAIGLSPGGTVVAQVQTRVALNAEAWGPQRILRPLHADELDDATALYAEADDIDWRSRDACPVGHDFLSNLTVILDGRHGRLIVDTASPLDDPAPRAD